MSDKMNPEAKAKIVEALRSGKYKQGDHYLQDKLNCFCVWGVISDVSGAAAWVVDEGGQPVYDGGVCIAADSVQKWTGITDNTMVRIRGKMANLIAHNDTGITFEQLADAIEEQL